MKRVLKQSFQFNRKYSSTKPNVTIFGNGFVGKHLIQKLSAHCNEIKVACRFPKEVTGSFENVKGVYADVTNQESVYHSIQGSSVVINTTNITYESENSWKEVLIDGTQNISFTCNNLGVKQLIHFSCIGSKVDDEKSLYADMKHRSEDMSYGCFPEVNVVKTSLIIGHKNKILDGLVKVARMFPVFPLAGGSKQLQPVHIDDVTGGVLKIIQKEEKGKTFEFVGPEVLSFSESLQRYYQFTGKGSKAVVSVPLLLGNLMVGLTQFLPSPTFSREVVSILENKLVASENTSKLEDLEIQPRKV